jgi:gluconate 5-dehydrogenase
MMRQNYGKIINLSSVYGLVGRNQSLYEQPAESNSALAYAAGKGAIVNLTRELAVQLAPYNITVNAIAPGMIQTDVTRFATSGSGRIVDATPLRRWGKAEELQGAFIFFASHASDFVTGQTLVVDGGWIIW